MLEPVLRVMRSVSSRVSLSVLFLFVCATFVIHAHAPAPLQQQAADAKAEGDALFALAQGHQARKSTDEARSAYERALQFYVAARDHVGVAEVHKALGLMAWQRGDAASVREHYGAAADAFAAAGRPIQQAMAMRSSTFAQDMSTGERIEILERALAMVDGTNDAQARGLVLHHLGDMLHAAGDYAQSLEKLEAAVTLLEPLANRAQYALALTSLGRTLRVHGQPNRALDVYDKVLAIQQGVNDVRGQAQTWNAMVASFARLGRPKDAKAAAERAAALAATVGDADFERFITSNYAFALVEAGDAAGAIAILEPLVTTANRTNEIYIRNALARAYEHQRRWDDAIAQADGALAAAEALQNAEEILNTLALRARVFAAAHRTGDAVRDVERALQLLEQLRTRAVPRDAMKRSFVEQHRALFARAIDLHHALGNATAAFDAAEQARARAFLDLLATRALQGHAAPQTADTLPASAAVPAPTAADVQATSRALNTTLISYWVDEDATTIWVIAPDGKMSMRRVDVEASRYTTLTRQVAGVVTPTSRGATPTVLTRSGSRVSFTNKPQPALKALHALLIAPIEPLLPTARGGLVTVVPHGPLFAVPFAALLDTKDRYLLEQYRLHMVPSAALLREPEKASSSPHALVVADPTPMPAVDKTPLPALPGARAEAAAIANLFTTDRVTLLTGASATKRRVQQAASQPAVVHLATHGLVFEDRPFDSYLALAGRAREGRLSASEIYRLSLNAELVVMSACRSASGEITGDGVLGLARAFFYAGAPSVIASLWDLPDGAARDMMPAFYREWLRTRDKAGALREAQLTYLRALRKGTITADTPLGPVRLPEHPALWAGLVLLGQP
jgi:CHAT domain-containing protein/tetratricopeptide (TPR) repeat protein